MEEKDIKAAIYDQMVIIEMAQRKINDLNKSLSEMDRAVPTPPAP